MGMSYERGYDAGEDSGYRSGREEGAGEEAEAWERALTPVYDLLMAYGVLDGYDLSSYEDAAQALVPLARGLTRRLGEPLDVDRVPQDKDVRSICYSPARDEWRAAYAVACSRSEDSRIALLETVGHGLGIGASEMESIRKRARR